VIRLILRRGSTFVLAACLCMTLYGQSAETLSLRFLRGFTIEDSAVVKGQGKTTMYILVRISKPWSKVSADFQKLYGSPIKLSSGPMHLFEQKAAGETVRLRVFPGSSKVETLDDARPARRTGNVTKCLVAFEMPKT
jgi:hypothetical protein